MISVFTPSFNKLELVRNAIDSVMHQTSKDFAYWIAENSTDPYTKGVVDHIIERYQDNRILLIHEYPDRSQKKYASSVYMNKYLDYMKGIVVWLSDDDLLMPNCFQRIEEEFSRHPEANVVYWSMTTSIWNGELFVPTDTRKAEKIITKGTNVDCMLDSGQIAFKVDCLKGLEKPYWREEMDNDTAHCDGIFFNRIVQNNNFYPINEVLSIKRTGPESVFTKK